MAEDVGSSLKLSTAVRNDGIGQVGEGLTHANQPGVAGKLSLGCTCLGRLDRVLDNNRVRRRPGKFLGRRSGSGCSPGRRHAGRRRRGEGGKCGPVKAALLHQGRRGGEVARAIGRRARIRRLQHVGGLKGAEGLDVTDELREVCDFALACVDIGLSQL